MPSGGSTGTSYGYDAEHAIYRPLRSITPSLHFARSGQNPTGGVHRGYAAREPEVQEEPHGEGLPGRMHVHMSTKHWPQKPAAQAKLGRWGPRSASVEAEVAHGELFPMSLHTVSLERPSANPVRLLNSGDTCTPRLPRGYGMTGRCYHGTLGGAFPAGDLLGGGAKVWTTSGTRRPPPRTTEVTCASEDSVWAKGRLQHQVPAFSQFSDFTSGTPSLGERNVLNFQSYSTWPKTQGVAAWELVARQQQRRGKR